LTVVVLPLIIGNIYYQNHTQKQNNTYCAYKVSCGCVVDIKDESDKEYIVVSVIESDDDFEEYRRNKTIELMFHNSPNDKFRRMWSEASATTLSIELRGTHLVR
jgi:hypothetical protein